MIKANKLKYAGASFDTGNKLKRHSHQTCIHYTQQSAGLHPGIKEEKKQK